MRKLSENKTADVTGAGGLSALTRHGKP